ncbi:MAG: cyclic nucleotide-binding domain-containing protein, partial [Actinobacteria bacterium]
TFLARFPPFDALSEEELERVARTAEPIECPAGATVLVEDGTPSDRFYVVRDGSVELVHEDEVIDVLEPGEGFGHPSLLTGMAPAFTVRAREDSRVLAIPREEALAVLSRPAGIGYVAGSLRERLTRTGHTVHGLPEVRTAHVGPLANRTTPTCPGDTPIRDVARLMTEAGSTAALVRMNGALGIVTDAELRERVVGGDVATDDPVSAVAVAPAPTVRADQLAVEAMIDLLERDLDHIVVLDGPKVLGTVSAHELVGLEGRSPLTLRRAILRAHDEDELVQVCARLPKVFLALMDADLAPPDVGRVLALAEDAATLRLIDFSIERHGPAPVPWAWLALGSAARRELTLSSDQDNALAYGDQEAPDETDAYFERLGREVTSGLVRCGWGIDPNNVVASNRLWRMSRSAWIGTFRACLGQPDESHLIRASVAFDFRHVFGGLDVTPPLVAVLRDAKRYPDFVRRLARTATDFKPPLGFRGSLVLDRDGGGSGRLDIKRGGLLPIANLARFHALAAGVTISATLDRLVTAEEIGALDAESAQSLREAFEISTHVRLQHHAARIEAGESIDDLVDPEELPPLARRQLREAFRAIAAAQKRLGVYVPRGI